MKRLLILTAIVMMLTSVSGGCGITSWMRNRGDSCAPVGCHGEAVYEGSYAGQPVYEGEFAPSGTVTPLLPGPAVETVPVN